MLPDFSEAISNLSTNPIKLVMIAKKKKKMKNPNLLINVTFKKMYFIKN